ncbi:hypothetical protein [Heyndrickxia oleronia]|nr:hypothetical protein [Heyndrickxia oleronia]
MSEIKPIQLPEETKEKILLFFLKTSIPRILAEEKEKEVAKCQ